MGGAERSAKTSSAMSPMNVAYCLYQSYRSLSPFPHSCIHHAFRSHFGDAIRRTKGKRNDKMSEICSTGVGGDDTDPPPHANLPGNER